MGTLKDEPLNWPVDDSWKRIHDDCLPLHCRSFYYLARLSNVSKSHLSSFSVLMEAPSEKTRSGMRQPAGELDTKSGNSSRTIMLTVFGSKDWRLSPTSAALNKRKRDKG